MAAAAVPRKTISIHDYPEHLNPFREDNHNRIRFWTLTRKNVARSNSISFSGIKDLKNSWAFRSFMRKGKKNNSQEKQPAAPAQQNGDTSPIVYRRALQYSSASAAAPTSGSRVTVGSSPERPDRYVYGGSITPLPRSRFQERLRSPSNYEVGYLRGNATSTPRMARSELGSRLSMESTNPFDEDDPVPPVRTRRKKKKAPLPPGVANVSVTSTESEAKVELQIKEDSIQEPNIEDKHIDETTLNIELKIVEDEDENSNHPEITDSVKKDDIPKTEAVATEDNTETEIKEIKLTNETDKVETIDAPKDETDSKTNPEVIETPHVEVQSTVVVADNQRSDSEDDIFKKISFPKVDIYKYRRNSSLNEDDFRLRRERMDTKENNNVRSKSLNNDIHSSHFTTYDINLNVDNDLDERDANHNQPQRVVCKLYDDTPRKQSIDVSISSTEKEFMEIDRATKELEREISKLNFALSEDDGDVVLGNRLSVTEIRKRFDNNGLSPNPIPKPRRSHYGSNSPINGNY